jgi:hypothetical protein
MANYVYPIGDYAPSHIATPPAEIEPQLPSVEAVIKDQDILPAYSLLLGLCEDNLPLVLDLTEPTAGAFLIAGDSGFANTTLLHSMITSAFLLNTEHELNVHLISPQADSLTHFHRQRNFKISYQPGRPECEIVMEEMVSLVQSRERSRKSQPIHALFIDSLDILWDSLSAQGKIWLNWITSYGARHGLWVFATLETDYLKPELYRTVDCFPSRILGKMQMPGHAHYLSGLYQGNLHELTPELEFLALSEGQFFNIWLLPSENDR